jgi:hypothetical protein
MVGAGDSIAAGDADGDREAVGSAATALRRTDPSAITAKNILAQFICYHRIDAQRGNRCSGACSQAPNLNRQALGTGASTTSAITDQSGCPARTDRSLIIANFYKKDFGEAPKSTPEAGVLPRMRSITCAASPVARLRPFCSQASRANAGNQIRTKSSGKRSSPRLSLRARLTV